MLKKNNSLVLIATVFCISVLSLYFYYKSQNQRPNYQPCAVEANGLSLPTVPSSSEMIGSIEESELFIASPEGSKIFAKGGVNYIVANSGSDEFYFSLCSSKIIEGQVSVIEGFDLEKDKIIFFCGHSKIKHDQVRIIHDEYEGTAITYVEVQGKHSITAVALIGNIDIKSTDIILNKPYKK